MKTVYILSATLLLAGCSGVTLKEPLPATELDAETRDMLQGAWKVGDTVVQVAFDEAGTGRMAQTAWEKDGFVLKTWTLTFCADRDTLYVSMPQEPDDEETYVFAELKPDRMRTIVWTPDSSFFKQAVEDGRLKGTVQQSNETRDIQLKTPSPEVLKLLRSSDGAFDYKNPIIFERIQ